MTAGRHIPTAGLICALVALAAAGPPELLKLDGDISGVHDPVIIKEGGSWYVFCTGGSIRRSKEARTGCKGTYRSRP